MKVYSMSLMDDQLQKIKAHTKTLELRLNDEKRQEVKPGDLIAFKSLSTNEKLVVKVLSRHGYATFKDLYEDYSLESLGYEPHETKDYNDMYEIYSKERIMKYGVVGFKVMPVEIVLENLTEEDFDAKGYVHFTTWRETYSNIMPRSNLEETTLEHCIDLTYKYPDNTIIAKVDDKVVGFGVYFDTGEIFAVYVLQAYQGIGIGSMLMDECISRLEGNETIVLWVARDNKKAIDYYLNYGFTLDDMSKELQVSNNDYVRVERMSIG